MALATSAPEFGSRLLRRVMIVCPETGAPTDTGHDLAAIPLLIGAQMLVDCLQCGQDHPWQLEDAFPE